VKQNLPPAKSSLPAITFFILTLAILASGCATSSRHPSSYVHSDLDTPKAERSWLININTATPQLLETLPGLGNILAERIVAYREQHGPFRRAEHLMMVRGISDRKFRAIRSLIIVQ
jgi:competence ComEA-like helix-hairpin-helix protein